MAEILFLAHRVPYPPDRGDKIRGYHLLRHLAREHRVHLVAFADDPRDLAHVDALSEWTASTRIVRRAKPQWLAAAQALLKGVPISLAAFDSRAMRNTVRAILAGRPIDRMFVFSGQMAQFVPTGAIPMTMDFVDMDSAKFAAYADEARGPMRMLMNREARLLQTFEQAVAARADASLFVSGAEAALFRARTGADRVAVIENGIDTAHFDPAALSVEAESSHPLIVFTGQMDYRPNIEAVRWFADGVLPLLRERYGSAEFAIVGRNPPPPVRALADLPGVVVTGEVPDVRPWLARATVVVAPLRLARGIQNKVLEGMAMARPVVASEAAAEGIDHADTIRVSKDAATMAAAIASLLDNPDAAKALGRAARGQVLARYGWDARLAGLDALVMGEADRS